MNRSLYYIFMIILTSCKSVSEFKSLQGEYYKRGQDFEYRLVLNEDSTFFFSQKYQDAFPQCGGKWYYDKQGKILLKCDEVENVTMTLTNGYMNKRNQEVRVINHNTLIVENVIVKRQKSRKD